MVAQVYNYYVLNRKNARFMVIIAFRMSMYNKSSQLMLLVLGDHDSQHPTVTDVGILSCKHRNTPTNKSLNQSGIVGTKQSCYSGEQNVYVLPAQQIYLLYSLMLVKWPIMKVKISQNRPDGGGTQQALLFKVMDNLLFANRATKTLKTFVPACLFEKSRTKRKQE